MSFYTARQTKIACVDKFCTDVDGGTPGQLPILAAKVVLVNRSPRRRSTSISLMTNCSLNEKRSDSASNVPFSYISPLPAKQRLWLIRRNRMN